MRAYDLSNVTNRGRASVHIVVVLARWTAEKAGLIDRRMSGPLGICLSAAEVWPKSGRNPAETRSRPDLRSAARP